VGWGVVAADRNQPTRTSEALDGLVGMRWQLTLAYRAVALIAQWVSVDGAAHSWRVRALSVGIFTVDLAVVRRLRESTAEFGFWPRLIWEIAYLAFWVSLPTAGARYDIAIYGVNVFLIEGGLRGSPLGLVALECESVVVIATRTVRGFPLLGPTLIWLCFSYVMGWVARRYILMYERRMDALAAARLIARVEQSRLGGREAAAIADGNAIDALGPLRTLLHARPGTALWDLFSGYKGLLSSKTDQVASHLDRVITNWTSRRNAHPDLSGFVVADIRPSARTFIVSAEQSNAIHQLLDDVAPRGQVTIDVSNAEDHIPGRQFTLQIGDRAVGVPADRRTLALPFDPGSLAGGLAVGWAVEALIQPKVSVATTLLAIVGWVAAAWALHKAQSDSRRRAQALWLFVAVSGAYSVAATIGQGLWFSRGGSQSYATAGFYATAVLAGFELGRRTSHGRAASLIVATIAMGISEMILAPVRQTSACVMVLVVWPSIGFVVALGLHRVLLRATEARAAQEDERAELLLQDEYDAGRRDIEMLVTAASQDAWGLYYECACDLEDWQARLVVDRLKEVDQWLSSTDAASSSLTTTS
nr:hypothetical protein [Actinomycetota bacterium]